MKDIYRLYKERAGEYIMKELKHPPTTDRSGPTQRELARMANVSMTTIYNVLHQPELVKKETLDTVRRIMAECNYHPDALAQAMVRGKSDIIGVMVPRFDIPYFADMVCCIERRLSGHNCKCLMIQHDDEPRKAGEAIRVFRQYRVAGIILRGCSLSSDRELAQLAEHLRIPFVLLDEMILGYENFVVMPADFSDGENAARQLLAMGCRRIGYIGWYRADSEQPGPRFEGAAAALAADGQALSEMYCPAASEYNAGREEVKRLWLRNRTDPPDGVICSNTSIAVNAYCGLRELGVRVPEDVKLVGFGELPGSAIFERQLIFTLRHDIERIAGVACETLIDIIESGRLPQQAALVPSRLDFGDAAE